MCCEITIVVKNAEKSHKQMFLCYEDTEGVISLSREDKTLVRMVEEVVENFGDDPDDVIVRAKMVW